MNYYFPGFLTRFPAKGGINRELEYTVNSGKNGLRLLLRSLALQAGSSVAIPAYVCPAVKEAVQEENLTPVELDLKDDKTYWTDYLTGSSTQKNIRAIVLVHLYGFIHPDTQAICDLSIKLNIPLIHDAAQSFGIGENKLCSGRILYSFGPGKATTAAGGGWIKGITKEFFNANITNWQGNEYTPELFLRSRIYGYRFTLLDRIKKKIARPIADTIQKMSPLQQRAASVVLGEFGRANSERKIRYDLLANAAQHNPHLIIPYNNDSGTYFKLVLFAPGLRSYLADHDVPHFSLFTEKNANKNSLPVFSRNARHFVEISTEASIPRTEIERIADILGKFAPTL